MMFTLIRRFRVCRRMFRACRVPHPTLRALSMVVSSMRAMFVIGIVAGTVAGCHAPTSPDVEPMRVIELPMVINHGDTVSMPGDTSIAYACVTQPREYIVNGWHTWTRDKYIDTVPCPSVPIR